MASKCLPSIGLPQVWLLCGGFYVWLLSAPVASMFGFCVASMVALCGFLWLRHVASKCLCGFYVWHLCGLRVASCGCDTWLRRVSVASMSGFYLAFMRGFLWLRQMASTCLCGFHVWLLCGIHVWFRVSSLLQCCVIALSVYVAGDMWEWVRASVDSMGVLQDIVVCS